MFFLSLLGFMGRFSAWLVQAGGIWTESEPSRIERLSMKITAGKNPAPHST